MVAASSPQIPSVLENVTSRDGGAHRVRGRYTTDAARGLRDGVAQTWWADGTPRSEATYHDGVAHGTAREWYASGAPFKELQLVDGQEEGLQRAWRENGALYANYEARDGRTYGLKRATLCYELNDEDFVVGP